MEFEIHISVDTLRRDIDTETYNLGRARRSSGKLDSDTAALLQAEDTDDSLNRHLHTALTALRGVLARYLSDAPHSAGNRLPGDITGEGQTVVLPLHMPSGFNPSAIDTLAAQAHAYIAAAVTAARVEAYSPGDADIYRRRAQEAATAMMTALASRRAPR